MSTLNVKIQEAHDTEANWSKKNPVLLSGQLAFSTDKNWMYKIGNGTKTWSQLNYIVPSWGDIVDKPSTFTPSTHAHDMGTNSISEKSTEGTRYVKFADLTCTSSYHRLNQQIIISSREESVLLNVKCQSSNSNFFNAHSISYIPLTQSYSRIIDNIFTGIVDSESNNKIELWYKQSQWGQSMNFVPIGKNKEGASLTFYTYDSTAIGSTTAPIFTTVIPLTNMINWNVLQNKPSTFAPAAHTHTKSEVGLNNVNNTADSEKSVKYATSAGSASSATTANSSAKDSSGQIINSTYIKSASVSGQTVTFTRGDDTTFNITTQDTNTVYAHPTSAGYKHIPSGGSLGQVMTWTASGTVGWTNGNNVLWRSSAVWPTASQTCTFSQPISRQQHGIIITFSGYDNGSQNADWHSFFISKNEIANHNDSGFGFFMSSTNCNRVCQKYLKISDGNLRGVDTNTATGTGSSGIQYQCNRFVLRSVIGV